MTTDTGFQEARHQGHDPVVIARLPLLDRFLPLWIAAAPSASDWAGCSRT